MGICICCEKEIGECHCLEEPQRRLREMIERNKQGLPPIATPSSPKNTPAPAPKVNLYDWVDLTPVWEDLKKLAEERDKQKRNFASSRYWHSESHFTGLLAEHVYGMKTGQKLDRTLKIEGDSGFDFPDQDCKGCTYWSDPWLKHPVQSEFKVNHYVLVALDINNKRGKLCGWATREEVQQAQTRDWGHGLQRSIPAKDLRPIEELIVRLKAQAVSLEAPEPELALTWNEVENSRR